MRRPQQDVIDRALRRFKPNALLDLLQFDAQGLIPAVIQAEGSRRVVTLCYLNREALQKTLREGKVYVFRRSQNRLMLKGETSGHIQLLRRVEVDCEGKSLILHVRQYVAGCHAGYFSCYYRELMPGGRLAIGEKRLFDPEQVYKHRAT